MTNIFKFPNNLSKSSKKNSVSIILLEQADFAKWIKKQDKNLQNQVAQNGFDATPRQTRLILAKDGTPQVILAGLSSPVHIFDMAHVYEYVLANFSDSFISKNVFEVTSTHEENISNLISIGWALGSYKFDAYKENKRNAPVLIWPKNTDVKQATASYESVSLLRNLINTPPNDLGTDELASAAKDLAKTHKAKIKIIKGEDLLKKNFPMIYNVGRASPRPPQLVDIKWGNAKHPKVTIVGKGIIYDTGGMNIKTGNGMRHMKKDMGGAAHALGAAHMIMSLNLPIQLRVLLPIAENSIAGNSYLPGDILPTRKGLTVEIENTDAEGRLVLADALTYACEEKPDLLIDFATLTGAARVAIGYDIPAYFSNRDEFIDGLRHTSVEQNDPIWPFPLWDGYDSNINGDVSDIRNDGTGRAGHIEAALFLQRFITAETDWIHLDCYAWENNGMPGRQKGGTDTGMRAIVNMIQEKYS